MYRTLLNTLPRPLLIRASYLFRKVAPLLYAGNNVACPVCENHFSKFLPYGSKVAYRKNVLCPDCLSLERHRLMWLYLSRESNFFQANLKVLHIAPEQCFYHRFRALKNLNYTTGDIESPLADVKFDLHQAPFEDNTFDVFFCNHVLEHVDDDAQCMRELYRILKPGGWALAQVPIDYSRAATYEDASITSPEEREKHFWQKDHVRLFGRDYPERLRAAGFEVEERPTSQHFTPTEIERWRLQGGEVLYVLRKP